MISNDSNRNLQGGTMNWKKMAKEFNQVVDTTMDDVSEETNHAAQVVGVSVVLYVVGSLSYFAMKAGKYLLK